MRAKLLQRSNLQDENGKSHEVKTPNLQQLDDLSDDPNLPPYTRTQILNVVSTLEKATLCSIEIFI